MARWTLLAWRSGSEVHRDQFYDTFRPSDEKILERYMLKFSKGGKAINLHEDDLGCSIPTVWG